MTNSELFELLEKHPDYGPLSMNPYNIYWRMHLRTSTTASTASIIPWVMCMKIVEQLVEFVTKLNVI